MSTHLEMASIERLWCEWVCMLLFWSWYQQVYFYFNENWSNAMRIFRITLTLRYLMMCQSRAICFSLLITARYKLAESKIKRTKSRRNSGKARRAFSIVCHSAGILAMKLERAQPEMEKTIRHSKRLIQMWKVQRFTQEKMACFDRFYTKLIFNL